MSLSYLRLPLLQRSACYSLIRKMSSQMDHLDRTAANTRHEVIAEAEVKKMNTLSNTVKMLHLYVKDKHFTFKAGQWVDLFIPGVEIVGGFSMCSSPDLLKRERIIQLAVKLSSHSPANWVHSKCQIGDRVRLRVGGDFFYDSKCGEDSGSLLLVAGGMGINPLFSILQQYLLLHPGSVCPDGDAAATLTSSSKKRRIALLYSAKTNDELIFRNELIQMTANYDNFQLRLCTTQEHDSASSKVGSGRIQKKDIQWALSFLGKKETTAYICGPPPFIDTVIAYCKDSSIQEGRILFEKWW